MAENVLVSTEWVTKNINNPNVRIVEVDYEPSASYELGHIPNSVLIDWKKDINNQTVRDILSKEQFEELNSRLGISNDTTVVLYGDFRNWFAAFAFWVYKLYGHQDVRLMNGGRKKWIEEKRELTKEIPSYQKTNYKASGINIGYRAYFDIVLKSLNRKDVVLIDVRSPAEYKGEITAPPEYPNEAAQRSGHIPGAINIPWATALNEDDTFKSTEDLKKIYQEKGITPDKSIIAYCRIGERSSVTWFVLKYLLNYPIVSNYDGSWSEWGNIVGAPIEK
ncbi:MAG: sulfurtransferase [Brevinematales bacterium]|nr:sulfurtransferase [Brevinematales bacterium]